MNRFFLFFFLIFVNQLLAQEPMTVIRCTAAELQAPIQNIYVDRDNKKWVGNRNGLFQVHAIDFATEEPIKAGEQALLKLPNGNNELTWSKSEMDKILGGAAVTAAFYDTKNRELWVGTENSGIIRLKTTPSLQKVGEVTSKNSKLKSNHINAINKDLDGRFWIGTNEGVLIGTLDKWKLEEKFFTIEAIAINRQNIWLMGDETVWKVEEGDEMYPIDIDERMVEGSIKDIAADSRGRIWIASDVVARYNFAEESYQVFGPAQYFTSQDVNYVAVDKDDALWVGTQDKGLYLIEKASAITVTLLVDKGLSCAASKPDAALKVRITGGQPPYFYDWDGGLKGEKPSGLSAGEYSVTVTDDKGKTKSAKVEIPDPRFTVDVVQDKQESGAGAGDAAATASVSGGGLPDFKYKWDTGETTAQALKLTEGLHSVTVTDQNGCTATASVNISQKLLPLKVTIKQTNENKCRDDEKAGIEVFVEGGRSPYKFKWNDTAEGGKTRSGLKFNQYTVTVTDGTGVTTAGSIVIKEIPAITANISVEKPASTGNTDGKAKVTANGGGGNFSYQWDNGETTQTATTLAPGSHSVTVTDASGCTEVVTTNISENILELSVLLSQTAKINCFGEANAGISATVNGGKGPFKYNWNVADISGEKPNNLPAGSYEVTLTDVTGATTTSKISIEQPSELSASATVQAAATTGNTDGKAIVKANGGSGDYTYKWDNGETDKTAKNLSPGEHSVTITDKAGCSTTASVNISENILELNVAINQVAKLDCFGDKNASLNVEVNGGKEPFKYQWSDANLTGEKPANLVAGNYALTLTDATGTTKTAQISIPEPAKLEATISVQQAATLGSSDGKATVKASGGSGDYTYRWDNGETDKIAKNLSSGAHSATITDKAGCSTIASVDISENILELNVAINQVAKLDCFGDKNASLNVEVNGGKGPFQYQWSDTNLTGEKPTNLGAGNYVLTLTDATGTTKSAQISIEEPAKMEAIISVQQAATLGSSDGKATIKASGGSGDYTYRWDNGETDKIAKSLSSGAHSATITDKAGCSTTASVDISENILELNVAINQVAKLDCFGDKNASLNVEVNGGKGPFQYQWSDANLTGEKPANLGAGNYVLTLTDATGTTKSAQISIEEPAKMEATISVQQAATLGSSDGKATVKASGGSGDYTYRWDNGETDKIAKSLSSGAHSATITDRAGCSTTASVDISENILELNVAINQEAKLDCFGDKNASLSVEVNGGKGPFQYQWSDANLIGEKPANLGAGSYTLTLTDAAGTAKTAQISITEPIKLEASISVQQPASTGNADGKATANAKGGDGTYTFRWSNGETDKTATKLAPGKHTATITDGKGCTTTADTEISENILPLAASISSISELDCFDDKTAALKVAMTGGKAPFTYTWNNPAAKGETPNNLPAGDYTVTATDATGATKTASFTINQPKELKARIVSLENTSDQNSNDGEAKIAAEGGAGNYTYTWDNGETGETARKFAIGKHTVTVKDAKGCTTSVDFEIKKKIIPELRKGRLSVNQVIRLDELYFDADSTVLNDDAMPILDEITYFLEQNPSITLEVGGHTNGVPPHEYCDALSSARAASIATYIYGQGIPEERLTYKGYGKRKPIASNKTADGRKRNQRVELTILSL